MHVRLLRHIRALFCVTLTLLFLPAFPLLDGAVPTALAASSCDGSNGVYLYENTNYGGRCIRLTSSVADLSTESFNNIASSIRFVGDWTATLYVDQNYGGDSSTFSSDDSNLGNNTIGNDRASSIRIQSGQNQPVNGSCDGNAGVYLYDSTNYNGRCVRITTDIPDLSTIGFNNVTQSLRIVGSWSVTLFVSQNYGGSSSTFTSDDSDLSNNKVGNNAASSARVQNTSSTGQQCDGGSGVYLYEHPNYQGRCIKFTADNGDLRTVNFDDTASSIRIIGGWTAVLARDLYLSGVTETFTTDAPNLANNPIGDNQVTSIHVQPNSSAVVGNCDGGQGVYLYESPNYQGRCLKFTGSVSDLRTVNFDDTASSLRTIGNWTVVLYADLNFTGVSSTFTTDDANLSVNSIGDKQATSIQVTPR